MFLSGSSTQDLVTTGMLSLASAVVAGVSNRFFFAFVFTLAAAFALSVAVRHARL